MTAVLPRPPAAPAGTAAPVAAPAVAPGRSVAGGRRRAALNAAGPALLISAGYVDPGNWGTDVAAGTQFGYRLLWVLAGAMLAAVFLQQLAARLGAASGHDLATLIHTRLPHRLSRCFTAPLLVALAVTEVVEVLGVVLGLQLLTGCDKVVAAVVGAGLVLVVLATPGNGARRLVYGCLGVVVVTYLVALWLNGNAPLVGGLHSPGIPPGGAAVAVGLVGSVIMPHNILLHTALARDASICAGPATSTRRVLRNALIANACALGLAFAVNVSITSMAVAAPAGTAQDGMSAAAGGLQQHFGSVASVLFACTLLASGLASATTGGMVSTDVVTRLVPTVTVPLLTRRLMFVVPAAAIACSPLPQIAVLVWSQVVLSCALPLVLLPLLWFVTRPELMGGHLPGRTTTIVAVLVTGTLVATAALSLL
jgi:manganese transport protein